jgi:curved DNA-binding protein CbpA
MSDADYASLQLRRGASLADARRAYHELSRRHHPDKGGDAALFRRVAQAYERISRGEGEAGGASGAPQPRTTREDAPAAVPRQARAAPRRAARGVAHA